jgi:hypothetical protein
MAKFKAIKVGRRGSTRLKPARERDSSFSRLFARFALTGLVAMLLISVAGFVLIRHSATASAIRQAKERAALAGRGIVEPLLTPRLLAGNKAALVRLDRTVRRRILRGTPIVRVKVWDAHGRIVYSDASSLIGARFPLGINELKVLRRGGIEADASDLARLENRSERGFKKLVEVYVGVRATDGTRLLYENYERSSTISASSQRQWQGLLPPLGGALAVLYLIQLPLAYSLARRLRRRQQEREELLRRRSTHRTSSAAGSRPTCTTARCSAWRECRWLWARRPAATAARSEIKMRDSGPRYSRRPQKRARRSGSCERCSSTSIRPPSSDLVCGRR